MSNEENLTYEFAVIAKDGKKSFEPQNDATRQIEGIKPLTDYITGGHKYTDLYIVIKRNDRPIEMGTSFKDVSEGYGMFTGLNGIYERHLETEPGPWHAGLEAKYFEVGDVIELTSAQPENFKYGMEL